ncbi:MAG: sigma-54 dependent transcriptional regulator [Pyrinomonadaceae bacterium MAG19_C2-C3]|nr:sigma-54 dependent transcriptional regulator [Pyrinomonadaceae bacterium MAG19_C2-C3]
MIEIIEMMPRILIADDDPDILEALRLLLKGEGFETEAVTQPADVLKTITKKDYSVALIDLNYARDTTSGREGLDLLASINALDATLPVVVMTAWGTVELAVEALRRGAKDFIQKPWDNQRLLTILTTQIELSQALRKGARLEAENRVLRDDSVGKLPLLIAESPAMQPVLELIRRIAPSDANVLITGKNGTGKEVVARSLHALSERAKHALVTVNAGALAEGTFESELFGHVKGAFTDARADRVGRFELADGGTLFLDEIANVPINLQPKLLRVLETGEFEPVGSSHTRRVNVRVLSATNAELDEEVKQGRFRQDLLFRLNTVEIHLPSLSERPEDVQPLAEHFLGLYTRRYRKDITGFDPTALRTLCAHPFPGNVRELDHVVERAVLMARGDVIQTADLCLPTTMRETTVRIDEMSLEEVERLLIQKALARAGGNVNVAAESLGLSRSALYRRIGKYEL